MRNPLWQFILVFCISGTSAQTLNFSSRVSGEVLTYFSPFREFADQSLLTRCNGVSPIEFNADMAPPGESPATYRFLIGHSTGTSSGERDFEVYCNDVLLFVFHTAPKMPLGAVIAGETLDKKGTYHFQSIEQDINKDAFGFLTITLSQAPQGKAMFRILGLDSNSRDWMMVFMYREGWKMNVFPTSLVLREGHQRQVNFSIDSPWPEETQLEIRSRSGSFSQTVRHGYQTFYVPMYPEDFKGQDTIRCFAHGKLIETKPLSITAVRSFSFHIIHHSHNDIGYSHLQTEVARIQTANIRNAMRWIESARQRGKNVYWHIESLWAVENFLGKASPEEKTSFITMVREGNIVLSANYANILTGLAQPEELTWMTEYARKLETEWGIHIRNAMITDIPGISYWGLKSYTDHKISYLSLGPNYVASLPDRGDRVGGVIRETGDKMFFWKADPESPDSLFVWTAGKGYSYFHNIQDNEKQFKWEQKLSTYVQELTDQHYPYDIVQLRYTKNADNGPVDTLLDAFVDQWNARFSSPALVISSIDSLFPKFISAWHDHIPVKTGGEISPYWEDGAYSTAEEENQARQLSMNTIETERWAIQTNKHTLMDWYPLHRNLVMWHEHTWGAWCSISDPEIAFTTEQWRIKKNFLDSALVQYARMVKAIGYLAHPVSLPGSTPWAGIRDFDIDPKTGGLKSLQFEGFNLPIDTGAYAPFQLIYAEGLTPTFLSVPIISRMQTIVDNEKLKTIVVWSSMKYFPSIITTYMLDRSRHTLEVRYTLNKLRNPKKESLHLCLPIHHERFAYGDGHTLLSYPEAQMAGSNYEFICTPHLLKLTDGNITYHIETPDVSLVELGSIIDEHQESGAKVWKREAQSTSPVYLYILNNYWHTNYKAYQEGKIEFAVKIGAIKNTQK